jgi:hypothetical protein
MVHGDPFLSPWTPGPFPDYIGRAIRIVVNFDDDTRAIINATVTRDDGCLWTKIVFDVPDDGVKSRRLPAPVDGAGPRTYTGTQIANQGYNTIEELMTVQITCER